MRQGTAIPGILLALVLHAEDLLLSECSVVIEPELGISGDQLALGVLRKRVDLRGGSGLLTDTSFR
jgi:hypothetical protein